MARQNTKRIIISNNKIIRNSLFYVFGTTFIGLLLTIYKRQSLFFFFIRLIPDSIFLWLYKIQVPRNAEGVQLPNAGVDLCQRGVISVAFDFMYLTGIIKILSCFSMYFYIFYLIVPFSIFYEFFYKNRKLLKFE